MRAALGIPAMLSLVALEGSGTRRRKHHKPLLTDRVADAKKRAKRKQQKRARRKSR